MKINWRYTLGELLIVTTGILIAFALNNWAEGQREKRMERQYLQSLKADLEADLKSLESSMATLEKNQAIAQQIMGHFRQELPGRDTIPRAIFMGLRGMPTFVAHEATYKTLTSSGDIRLISDFQLKNQIVEHYNRYVELYNENERTLLFVHDFVSPYYMREASFETLHINANDILNDHRVRNMVYAWFGIFQIQIRVHEKAINRGEELVKALNEQTEN